jgi:putative Mg2+ transporter-C (MgtC) family protein
MGFLDNPQVQIILQLLLAAFLGGLVGLEREYKRKEAGLRTYSLVSLGAALFTIVAFQVSAAFLEKTGTSFDPSRIIGQIVLGVGFIGAGLIIYRQFHLEGLTTAAGLWVVAGIGVAVAAKLYLIAVSAAILAIIILAGLRVFEEKFREKMPEKPE